MATAKPARQKFLGQRRGVHPDSGIGLVEVVVALFILSIMALGVLPLLISSVKVSTFNRDLVAATTFANSRLAQIRDAFPDTAETACSAVTSRAVTGAVDPAGTGLRADVVVGTCPTSFPDAVVVRVTVRDPVAARTMAELHTQIVVTQS